jgi:hypothetical protein
MRRIGADYTLSADPAIGIWLDDNPGLQLHDLPLAERLSRYGCDQVQAILSGKTTPAEAVQTARKNADELLRGPEAAGVTLIALREHFLISRRDDE